MKLRIKPKTYAIPVVFYNLRDYDETNNMEKYIPFSVGGFRFIDRLNCLQGSLDSLVKATPKEILINTAEIAHGSDLLFKKGIYPYEYMDS